MYSGLKLRCCLQDADLRVLSDWRPNMSWTLNPGDMLYVPPNMGHEGLALGNSQTLSIGFLAPCVSEMLLSFAAEQAAALPDTHRFYDPCNEVLITCRCAVGGQTYLRQHD
jgi:50S ribosomal protein L16 3-hydroxylase